MRTMILPRTLAWILAFLVAGCASSPERGLSYPQDFALSEDDLYGDLGLVEPPSPNVAGRRYLAGDYIMDQNPGWAMTDWDEDLPRSLRPERHFVSVYERHSFPTDVLIIDAMEFSDQETADRWLDELEGWCLGGDEWDESAVLLQVENYVVVMFEENLAGAYGFDDDEPPGWDDEREDEDLYEIREWKWFIAYDLEKRLGADFIC